MIQALLQLPPVYLCFLTFFSFMVLMFGAFWLLERRDRNRDIATEIQNACRETREREEHHWRDTVAVHEKKRRQAEQELKTANANETAARAAQAARASKDFEDHKTAMQGLRNDHRQALNVKVHEYQALITAARAESFSEGYRAAVVDAHIPPQNPGKPGFAERRIEWHQGMQTVRERRAAIKAKRKKKF